MAGAPAEGGRFRTLSGPPGLFTRLLLMGIPVVGAFFILDIPSYLNLALFKWGISWRMMILQEQYFGIFLAMILGGVFLIVPPTRGAARDRVPWYDALLSILGFAVGLYVAFLYPRILWELGIITPDRVIMGGLAILLVLEALRRLTGWFLVGLGLFFITYARFTWLFPGVFYGRGTPWDQLTNYLFLDPNALLGLPIKVTAGIVLAFIFFGNMLFAVGGGKFLTDIAMATFGRFRGGPAKMAVVASSLFGTISGSAVSNVATTGVMTIPLMKQSGYRPHIAGAVEAVASTGGQLMPPIMGAAAFLIAEFIGVPYRQVIAAALLPAILYYLAVFVQVDLEAGKSRLLGLSRDQLPHLRSVMGQSWLFLVPLGVLLYALFTLHFEAGKAGFTGVLSILVLGFLLPRQTRFRGAWIKQALESTGRSLMELTVIVALAGFIIGAINVSGLGFNLSLSLVGLAGGNIGILLLIV
ncbi:MAG: TRAP transporter fused permease subunit, partial [Dehalococcoidia bacterium]